MVGSELVSLAQNNSQQGRDELLTQIVSLFESHDNMPTELEQTLFSSLTQKLIKEVSRDICRNVASQLSESQRLPHELAVNLAQSDNPDVFAPILAHSDSLTEEDLVAIIMQKGTEHALSITQRETLSPLVTDALVENGTSDVVSATTQNTGASFSEHGLSVVLDRSALDPKVRDALCQRTAQDEHLFKQMRNVIEEKFGSTVDKSILDSAFSSDALETYLNRLTRARLMDLNNNIQLKSLVAQVKKDQVSADDAVFKALEMGSAMMVVGLIAMLHELPAVALHKSYVRGSDKSFSLVLYMSGVRVPTYRAIAKTRVLQLGYDHDQIDREVDVYRDIQPAEAKRAVRLMKIAAKTYGEGSTMH